MTTNKKVRKDANTRLLEVEALALQGHSTEQIAGQIGLSAGYVHQLRTWIGWYKQQGTWDAERGHVRRD